MSQNTFQMTPRRAVTRIIKPESPVLEQEQSPEIGSPEIVEDQENIKENQDAVDETVSGSGGD